MKGDLPEIPDVYSKSTLKMIQILPNKDPKKRPDTKMLMELRKTYKPQV